MEIKIKQVTFEINTSGPSSILLRMDGLECSLVYTESSHKVSHCLPYISLVLREETCSYLAGASTPIGFSKHERIHKIMFRKCLFTSKGKKALPPLFPLDVVETCLSDCRSLEALRSVLHHLSLASIHPVYIITKL